MRTHFYPVPDKPDLIVECRIYDHGSFAEESEYRASYMLYLYGSTAKIRLLTRNGEPAPGECSCGWDAEVDREMEEYARRMGATKLTYRHKREDVVRHL